MKASQMLIDQEMDKPNVVYTRTRIFFSVKKERNSNTCYDREEPGGYSTK